MSNIQVGQGNQNINYNYQMDVDSKYLNKLFYNIITPGILYDGDNHENFKITSTTSINGNTITVNPISFMITPKNRPDILVKIDTTKCFTKTYEIDTDTTSTTIVNGNCKTTTNTNTTNIKLIARYIWSNENDNVAEFLFTFNPLDTDLILCEIIDDKLSFNNQTVSRLQLIKPNATFDDADTLDCYSPGNSSGDIPINNKVFSENLNIDTLQLYPFGTFAINDETLQDNLVTEQLNGHTIQPQDGSTIPGSNNDIPVSNGILQKDLNAQYLNGKDADYYLNQVHTHDMDDLINNDFVKVENVNSSGELTYKSLASDDIGVDKLSGIGYDTTSGTTYKLSTLTGKLTLRDIPFLDQSERYIVDDTNNKLYWYENSTTTLIISELTNGNYGADELASLIETKMEADGVNTYTVSYDDTTNKFGFLKDSGTNFELLYNPNFLTNGNFESWASTTDVNNWTEYITGTSTVNREAVLQHSGTYCVRMDVDASNSLVYIHQNITLYKDTTYNLDFWYLTSATKTARYRIKDNTTGKYLQVDGSWGLIYDFVLSPVTSWTNISKTFIPETNGTYSIIFRNLSAASSSIYFDDVTVTDVSNISHLINFSNDSGFVTIFDTDEVFGEDFYTYSPEEVEIDFETVTGINNIRMKYPRVFLQKVSDVTDLTSTDISKFSLRNAFAYDITNSGFKVKQFSQVIISSDTVGSTANTYIKVDRSLKEDDFTYNWVVFGEKYIES